MACDDLHDIARKQMLMCVRCGKCRAICPTLDAESPGTPLWEIFGARGRVKLALGLNQAHIPINELFVKSEYSCFFCNACVEECPSRTKVTDIIALTRNRIYKEGKSPPAEIMMNKAVIESGSIFNLDSEDRMLWAFDIEDIVESKINIHAKILYFIGCQASYKGSLAKIPLGFVKLLEHLKVDYTLLAEEERCCGSPMFLIGNAGEFAIEARKKISKIKNLGVHLVLTTCPSCYNSFRRYEKILGEPLPFKLQFATDFLNEKLVSGELKIKRTFPEDLGIVTYHDACELGRHQAIYESPRRLIKAIPKIQYKEMAITREKTHCCGGGGLVAVGFPEIKNAQSARKILEFQENNMDTVVTACVGCYDTLSQAANVYNKQQHDKCIRIMDLIDLLSNLVD